MRPSVRMTAADLYTQVVLDHYRSPRNFGELPGFTHAAEGHNPLCGDGLHIQVHAAGGRVSAMRFRGEACAIATAAASMLSELAVGRDLQQLEALAMQFAQLVGGELEHAPLLMDLNAMRELAYHPLRRKCALLAFATLSAALRGAGAASTEGIAE